MPTVVMWWILTTTNAFACGGDCGARKTPEANGPYPSAELCRLAGRNIMPSDRQFWTEAEKEAQLKREAERDSALKAKIAAALKKNGGKAGSVSEDSLSCSPSVLFDAQGEIIGAAGGCTTWGGYIEPTALTGCVAIPQRAEKAVPR